MIVQACLNGARTASHHPRLPLTIGAIVADARACIAAGAAELHVHPRDEQGRESLAAVDETMRALREACPGTLIGVSTGAWIENDEDLTRERISQWRELPDYASVNLSENDAEAVIELLHEKGIGVEAGLASVDDARRLVKLVPADRMFRVLIEIEEQEPDDAFRVADDINAVLGHAGIRRPVLAHGFDATVWPIVDMAVGRRWSTRIGLEDGNSLPDGTVARDNAELVAGAVGRFVAGLVTGRAAGPDPRHA